MGPIIFFNTAWMERYEGLVDNDKRIYGGGSFIEKNGEKYMVLRNPTGI